MDRHLGAELSAYLDDELDAAQRVGVERHLGACSLCASRLAELRGAARLIAALPLPEPTRSLVPKIAPARVSWLRPVRSLSALATGAFVFLFMASAVLETDFRMGGGTVGAPAAEGARGGQLLGSPAPDPLVRGPAGPAGAAAPSPAPAPVAADSSRSQAATAAPTSVPQKSAQEGGATPTAGAFGAQPATAERDARALATAERPTLGSPWVWLGLALACAALAFALHRRLRSA